LRDVIFIGEDNKPSC